MTEVERTVMFTMPNLLSGQIACIAGTTAGRSWELGAGTFTIGRLDEHDLCLANEPGVSKTHAKIVAQGDRYVLVDCESRNGTILNGTNIQKAEIYDGDEIRICGCVLRFQQTGGSPRPKKTAPERTQTDIQVSRTSSRAQMPAASPTATYQQPAVPPPAPTEALPAIVVAAPVAAPPSPPAPPVGRVLAGWYAAGFAMSIVLGGAGTAALALTAPEPVIPAEASPSTTPPHAPTAAAGAATAGGDTAPAVVNGGAVGVVDAGSPAAPPPEPPPATPEPAPAGAASAKAPEPAPVPAPETAPEPTTKHERVEATKTAKASASARYAASVDGSGVETVRTKTGGKVASVDVADGATVTRGQRLVTFDTGGDPGEIQTLQDRIASLENADDDEAKRDLKTAKQRLAALEAGRGAPPVVAGSDGTLTGFNVVVGALLKAGDVVGKVSDGDVPTRVRISVGAGVKIKAGQSATLILKSGGTADGSVVSVTGRSVVVDTGSVAGDAVDAVEF
jgi:predicted component of type VI protein secretion system